MVVWVLNLLIAFLMGINTLGWGLCIRDLGSPSLSINFLLKLCFNRFFILGVGSAFSASLLRYGILQGMGVLKGGFFLTTSTIASVFVAYLLLGERLTWLDLFGIGLILSGVFLLGR